MFKALRKQEGFTLIELMIDLSAEVAAVGSEDQPSGNQDF